MYISNKRYKQGLSPKEHPRPPPFFNPNSEMPMRDDDEVCSCCVPKNDNVGFFTTHNSEPVLSAENCLEKNIFLPLFVKRAVVGGSIYISIIREFESQSDSPPPEGWMGRRSTQVAIHGKR